MRRLRILVVGSLAVASVTAWAGTAHAARGSDFCDQANDLVGDLGGFDPLGSGNSDELDDQIDATVDAYQELEESAPKKLRKAFRVNRNYYELFQGGVDLTDPEQLRDIARRTARVIRANTRILNYLTDECGIEAPDVSVPEITIPGRSGN